MTGVLLVNMGSPSSRKEMKSFLHKMFLDKAIIPYPTIPRFLLASIISSLRYKKSWRKYQLIGGSPLKNAMAATGEALKEKLGSDYAIHVCYSYSSPSIKNGIDNFNQLGIKTIIVIPTYPQPAYSTTSSVKSEIEKRSKDLNVIFIDGFFKNKYFIQYWKKLIEETKEKHQLTNPVMLFSAHSIPQHDVDDGDSYVANVKESAQLISGSDEYYVSFQSKMGRLKWAGPDTQSVLKDLSAKGIKEIVIVPVSFVNENLETLYDLDLEIIPYGKKELNIEKLCRVHIPETHHLLIESFKDLVYGHS